MSDVSPVLVFDTGPIRHFALQGWLRVLQFLAGGRQVVIPDSVAVEIADQIHVDPGLRQVLDADWIRVDRSTDADFMAAFGRYEDRLVVGTKNRGECGVLALGEVRGFEVVIDDGTARTIAAEKGIRFTTTLALLCGAIREKHLTVAMVEKIADDLLTGDYYLPFSPGGFRSWALETGLIDYGD